MAHAVHTTRDTLTGLPDQAAFLSDFTQALAQAENTGGRLALALVDLDVFSTVNKEYGAEVGDEALQALARYLEACFATAGTVYRYGGDALMVMLPGIEKERAFLMAEQARAGFDKVHDVEVAGRTTSMPLTVSIGIAAYPDDSVKDSDILRKANEAVYRAKVSGRNKVCLAREEKMVTKTSYYKQGQLEGLSRLAKREGLNEAVLLREALDDLLRKYNR